MKGRSISEAYRMKAVDTFDYALKEYSNAVHEGKRLSRKAKLMIPIVAMVFTGAVTVCFAAEFYDGIRSRRPDCTEVSILD